MTKTRDLSDFLIEGGADLPLGKPHIVPDVLYPAVSGKLLDGSTSHGTGTYNGVSVSTNYGTTQSDGRKYYYTDIKGSKPIKDPRIGGHFGSQRHKIKSIQLLEQETATHGENVYSLDGRNWAKAIGDWNYNNDSGGVGLRTTNSGDGGVTFIEVIGYFNDFNLLTQTQDNADQFTVVIDGGSALNTDFGVSVSTPLGGRYVDKASVLNMEFNGGALTLGIHTIKIYPPSSFWLYAFGFELIAQDTSNRNNIQIPSQNVVSFGKKFTVSAEGSSGHHYNPFNGYTATTSFSSVVDVDTSLGLEAWKHTDNNYYPPVNGGRVVKWVDSSGTIKTSVTLMPPNATGTGSVSSNPRDPNYGSWSSQYQPTFKNETERQLHEVAKTFVWREFGNGSANGGTGATYADASMLSGEDNIAYVMDDGLTALSGNTVFHNSTESMFTKTPGTSRYYITFIGTGVSALAPRSTDNNQTLAQNLPYGTHVLEVFRDSSTTPHKLDGVQLSASYTNLNSIYEVTFHQPKRPPIPEDACVIADYMLMADFVPQTSAGVDHISKGVRRVDISRDIFFDRSDGTAVTLSFSPASWLGGRLRMDLSGTASSDTSCTIKLPAFGDNYVIRGYDVNDTLVPYIGGVSKASDSTFHNGTVYGSYAHLTNNLTDLGTYSFEANFKQSERGYATEIEIATPIHTSSHYQSFETPFLHELVGGDRNMEQHNLVVSPDGKTWDQITRDTSYMGNGVVLASTDTGSTASSTIQVFDDWRGKIATYEKHAYNKDFAIAYNKLICLKDGQYKIEGQTIRNGVTLDYLIIRINGTLAIRGYVGTSNHSLVKVTLNAQLKRGDDIQVSGGWYGDQSYSQLQISRI